MLQSYREAYAAAAEGDSLTVMSPGLGLHHVVQAFVQTHCVARGPLVLVVNAKAEERSRLLSGLFAAGVLLLPRVVRGETAKRGMRRGVAVCSVRVVIRAVFLSTNSLQKSTNCSKHSQ